MDNDIENKWHLDKKIPIGIILALLLQSGLFFKWVGSIDMRMDSVEKVNKEHAEAIKNMTLGQQDLRVSLTRIEERQQNSLEALKEIKAAIKNSDLNGP